MAYGPKTILFSPVRVDSDTLDLALRSHAQLKGVSERWYCDDNVDTESSTTLYSEWAIVGKVDVWKSDSIGLDADQSNYRTEETHTWDEKNISRVARMRNDAIQKFLKTDASFLFIVDSDLVLHPDTVEHLVSLNIPIVSMCFWTNWQLDSMYAPQVWDVHPFGHRSPESLIQLKVPGQYEVGGLGACTLIRRDVFEAGVDYSPLPSTGFEGEDRAFSIRATVHKFPLIADTHYPPFHVYRKSQVEEARIWFEQGCSTTYFNECWLTEAWENFVHAKFKAKTKTLALCLPGETFNSKYLMNVLDLYKYVGANYATHPYNSHCSGGADLVRWALTSIINQREYDYVLWMDDDNLLSTDHFKLLMAALDNYPDIDLIAGWCPTELGSVSAGIFQASGPQEGLLEPLTLEEIQSAKGLINIDWTGFPGVLMRGSLLRKLGADAWLKIPEPRIPWGSFGEDASFCKRARAIGAHLALDPRVQIPHLKTRPLPVVEMAVSEKVLNA